MPRRVAKITGCNFIYIVGGTVDLAILVNWQAHTLEI
jgi:hypothetical protein